MQSLVVVFEYKNVLHLNVRRRRYTIKYDILQPQYVRTKVSTQTYLPLGHWAHGTCLRKLYLKQQDQNAKRLATTNKKEKDWWAGTSVYHRDTILHLLRNSVSEIPPYSGLVFKIISSSPQSEKRKIITCFSYSCHQQSYDHIGNASDVVHHHS